MPKRKKNLPPGMAHRGRVYWADFRCRGRRVRKSLSRNLKVATELLTELRARAQRSDFDLLDNDYSLTELREQYLRHCRQVLKGSSVSRYVAILNRVLDAMPQRVSRLTVEAVLAYRESRLADDISPSTIDLDIVVLSAMLNWGVEHRLLANNPIKGLKPLPHDNPKEGRALTDSEVERLLDASGQPWWDIWYCLLVTGMRKSELAALTFNDIDWDAREVIVRQGTAKNHTVRRIPIDPKLWDILCRQKDGRKDRQPGTGVPRRLADIVHERFSRHHVFVTTKNTPLTTSCGLYLVFLRCCRQAGIEVRRLDAEGNEVWHVDLHSTRRTFATNLIVNGADPKSVQELLGHKTLAMTMNIYAQVRSATKRQALRRLSYGASVPVPGRIADAVKPGANGHDLPTTPHRQVVAT